MRDNGFYFYYYYGGGLGTDAPRKRSDFFPNVLTFSSGDATNWICKYLNFNMKMNATTAVKITSLIMYRLHGEVMLLTGVVCMFVSRVFF